MKSENYIKKLFDFQKFEGNEKLKSVIDDSLEYKGNAYEMSEDELSFVAAAGIGTNSNSEMGAMIQDSEHFIPVECNSSVCRSNNIVFYITGRGCHYVVCPYCKMQKIIAG